MADQISGGDPLNSETRGWLGRALTAVRAAFTPTPRAAAPAANPEQAAAALMGGTLARFGELKRSAGGESPRSVAGAGWIDLLDPALRTHDEQQDLFGSEAAKYGRFTTAAGIGPQAFAAYNGTQITLERIAEIHMEVDQQGLLHRKQDLDFALLRGDAHLYASQRARAAAAYRSPLQWRPYDHSPLARFVCGFVRAIVEDIDGLSEAEDDMASAAAFGFSALEVIWRTPATRVVTLGKRSVTVRGAKGIAELAWVHGRDFRWHPIRRRFLLDAGGTRYVDPFRRPDGSPTHKVIMHSAPGVGDPHQRGYMWSCEPLILLKRQSFARWAVMLELLGIQTPYLQFEAADYADAADISSAIDFLGLIGRGKPAVLAKKFGDVKLTPSATGVDGRGQHAAILGVINGELSKVVQGQILSMEAGGSGSYALADVQASSKEDVWLLDLKRACETHRSQLARYIVEENATALAAAFGVSVAQVLAVVPRCYRVLDRRVDPVARLNMFKVAREMGMEVDPQQIAEECNFRLIEKDADATPELPSVPEAGSEPDGDESEADEPEADEDDAE